MKNYWVDLYIKIINQFLIAIINNVIELLHYLMLINWGVEAWMCGRDKVSHCATPTAIRKMIGQTDQESMLCSLLSELWPVPPTSKPEFWTLYWDDNIFYRNHKRFSIIQYCSFDVISKWDNCNTHCWD